MSVGKFDTPIRTSVVRIRKLVPVNEPAIPVAPRASNSIPRLENCFTDSRKPSRFCDSEHGWKHRNQRAWRTSRIVVYTTAVSRHAKQYAQGPGAQIVALLDRLRLDP